MDTALLPNLFLDKETSDIQLHIYTNSEEPDAVVPAHSLILKTAGKVFRALLDNSNFKENQNRSVYFMVKGDVHDAIRFLRYLYTRELDHVNLKVYISLLQTAQLYELDDLAHLCNERIAGQLAPLTVCRTYRSVKNFASESLLTRCKELMLDCAFLIFWKNLHFTLDEKTMVFLFESDRLNFLDQEQALAALKQWGCAQRAIANQKDQKENAEHFASLLTKMEKSLADNASWLHGLWKNFALPPQTSGLVKKYAGVPETFSFGMYWTPHNKEDSEANQSLGTYAIKTEPRLRNQITKFAKVCCLIQDKDTSNEISITSKGTYRLMNVCVNRNVLLAGFAIQIKGSIDKLTNTREKREQVSFRLNDKELLVNNYKATDVRPLYYPNSEEMCDDWMLSYLKVSLRTPVFLQKARVNILTIEFDPAPLFSTSLIAYTFPGDSMLHSDDAGLFSKQDEKVAVSRLYYFV